MSKKYSDQNNASFVNTIRKLRAEAGLSQQDVADAVGIARATYVKLENGGREPKQSEILALARYYEVSPLTIMTGGFLIEEPPATYNRIHLTKAKNHKKMRQPASALQPPKLRATLLYLLGTAGAKPNFGESTLYKILYLIDEGYRQNYDQTITGLCYIAGYSGFAPEETFAEFTSEMMERGELEIITTKHYRNTQRKYLPVVAPELSALSGQELLHIDQIVAQHAHKTPSELTALMQHTKVQ
jgi:transcriptional regulator with XRE-family HTH domain